MAVSYAVCLCILVGYLAGSLPIGFIVARLKGVNDIRAHGSGAIGATNVSRMLGAPYFFLIFILDFIRAYGIIRLIQWYGMNEWHQVSISLALLIGNGHSLFLNFTGGKGVATSCGILCAFNAFLVIPLLLVGLGVFLLSSTVGVSSIVAFVALPLSALFVEDSTAFYFLTVSIAGIGIWFHRANLQILLSKLIAIK